MTIRTTPCRNGHPGSESVWNDKLGHWVCRACRRDASRRRIAKYRAVRAAWRKQNGPAVQRERERHKLRMRERRTAGEPI